MNICNCHKDIDKFLCDVPFEWREPITNALCFTLSSFPEFDCGMVKKCETLTSLSSFTLNGTLLSISFKNERGQTSTSTVDISGPLNEIGNGLNPSCLMGEEEWEELSLEEKLQVILNAHCDCCTTTTTTTTSTTTTTTTSSTTTTTTAAFHYFLADQFVCLNGNCLQVDTGVAVQVPSTFTPTPGFYYLDEDGNIYSLFVQIPNPGGSPVVIDIESGSALCNSTCPTTTTTTSTTTTTTCCPITDSGITESSTTTTSTTTTSSTTTTTTAAPTTTTTTSTTTSSTTTTTTVAGVEVFAGYFASDPYPGLQVSDGLVYQLNQSITAGTDYGFTFPPGTDANYWIVFKEPSTEPVKTEWVNGGFNFGFFPDSEYYTPFITGSFRYYVSRHQTFIDTTVIFNLTQ